MNKNFSKLLYGIALISLVGMNSACSDDKDFGEVAKQAVAMSSVTIGKTDYTKPDGNITLLKNGEIQIPYTIAPENATKTGLKWSSSNTSVVTVSQEGVIKAGNETGEAVIYVTPEVGFGQTSVTPSFKVEVVEEFVYMSSLSISTKPEKNVIAATSKFQLAATSLPEDVTFKRYTWTSNKPSVATVDENGLLTGIAEGRATITVTADDLNPGTKASASFEVEVQVSVPITKISFSDNEKNYLSALGYGETYRIAPVLEPADATASLISWSSDNPGVISVDDDGVLTVHTTTTGTANITATYNDIVATVEANVAEGRFWFSFANEFPSSYWRLPKNGTDPTTKSDEHKTIVTMGVNGEKHRADIVFNQSKINITPGTYRYIAMKVQTRGAGNITFALYDKKPADGISIGENYLGLPGSTGTKANNAYTVLGGGSISYEKANVIYYDLQGRFANKSWDGSTAAYTLASLQFKMADFKTSTTYDIYWIRAFKTMDELENYVKNENLNN